MKNLDYRTKDGEKPWYKRWKSWAIIVAALIVINIFAPEQPEKAAPEDVEKPVTKSVSAEKPAENSEETEKVLPVREVEDKAKVESKNFPAKEKTKKTVSRDVEIRSKAELYIKEYKGSKTVEIKVSENIGAGDGSFIVLAYMSYPANISAERSRKMVEMFSSDLAANLARESDVSAVTVFWEVPKFLNSGNAAKFAYERLGDGMRLESQHIAPELQ